MAEFFNQNNLGSFVPTSFSWEIAQLQEADIDPKLKSLMIRLYQNLNIMALILNQKDTGYYVTQELVNGQQYFANPNLNPGSSMTPMYRQVYRVVIDFGALPNNTTKSIPHNIAITENFSLTRLYGAATNPSVEYIPLPFVHTSPINKAIEVTMDATYVNIHTQIDYTAYTKAYVVIEYLKS